MSYPVDSQPPPTFSFTYQGYNKTVDIEIGHDSDLLITNVLEAVKDVLIAGGFDYVDEVRAINYGEKENTIHSSDSDGFSWKEPADIPPPNDYDDLPRLMAEETLREAGFSAAEETAVNSGISSMYYEEPDEREFHD